MKVIKKTKNYIIYQKRSGRYGVQDSAKHWINQEEKVDILAAEGLIKMATAPKAVPEKSEKEKHRKAAETNEQSPANVEEDAVSEASAAESEEDTVSEASAAESEDDAVSEASAAEVEEGAIAEEVTPKKTEKKPRAKRAKKPDDEATKTPSSTSKKKKTKSGDN